MTNESKKALERCADFRDRQNRYQRIEDAADRRTLTPGARVRLHSEGDAVFTVRVWRRMDNDGVYIDVDGTGRETDYVSIVELPGDLFRPWAVSLADSQPVG